ncbi:MAG: MFS transporter [Aerococcus sp.]|nr:MFS transporter [Aerococcus sp.]
MANNKQKAVIASIIASGTDDLNVMFLSFSMSSIIQTFHLSGVQGGAIATLTNLGMLVGGVIFGMLGDRHNKMTILKWTLLIFCLASGGIAFASNITMIYLLRFLAGIGVGGEYGIALSIMANLVPLDKMGRVSSLNGVAGQIGSITSALLAGLFLPQFGWRGLFLFGLAPLLLVGYMHWNIQHEAAFEPQNVSTKKMTKSPLSVLFQTPALAYQTIALMIMTTVQIAGYFGMMNWLPTIMQQQTQVSVSGSSIWMIATIIGMSLGMLTFGRLLDTFGPRLTFGGFLITSAAAVYLFSLIHSQWGMILGGAAMGFFVNGMFPGYGAVVSHLYPKNVQSTANNLILNVGRAIGGFSSIAIGGIMEHYGITTVMLSLAALYLISFTVMMTIPSLRQENYQTVHYQSKAHAEVA